MSELNPDLVSEWQAAVGRAEVQEQRLELESLRRFALAVGSDPNVEQVLPPLPHWAYFLPGATDERTGPDGHPERGGFLPAITLPRRMFAAGRMRVSAPLAIGQKAELRSVILSVTPKSGRSGDMVFVEVERALSQFGVVRLIEEQTYVYRGNDGKHTLLPVNTDPAPEGEVWKPTSVNLFRFSSATFNSHRIHYDEHYATTVEGYPALVVHGPFTATKLANFAARKGRIKEFAFRAQAPLFLGQPVALQQQGETVTALRCDGATAMTAEVKYA